jgi:hypothetical protein
MADSDVDKSWEAVEAPATVVEMTGSTPASMWLAHSGLQQYEQLFELEEGDDEITADDLLAYIGDEDTLAQMDAADRATFESEILSLIEGAGESGSNGEPCLRSNGKNEQVKQEAEEKPKQAWRGKGGFDDRRGKGGGRGEPQA